jgi:hypothetical protein
MDALMNLALETALRSELGLPRAEAGKCVRSLTRRLSRAEKFRLKKKIQKHPILSGSREWVWVTPGNVPEPIALAIHAAAIHHAKLTLKISKKMTKTGRALVRALRAPGQVIHVIGDASRIARDTEAAWMIYGKDSTIVDIRSRLPRNIPAGEMGERFSISIIFKSALKRGISLMVRECARDIRTYDQKGCLSAQILWVQGDADAARSFGQKLLLELQRLDKSEGCFKRDRETGIARTALARDLCIRSLDPAQLAQIGPAVGTRAIASAPFLYLLKRGHFMGPAIGQIAALKAFDDVAEVVRVMRPHWNRLQGVAVAGNPRERLHVVKNFKASSAVYFPPPGKLQTPPVDWQL